MLKKWQRYFIENKTDVLFSILSLGIILFLLTRFLTYVERREGVILPDPLLERFTAIELTWLIFGLIYISLIAIVFYLIQNPPRLIFALKVYTLMVIIRIVSMAVVPFAPPRGMILLLDPFVEYFGTGATLSKDLFFSGHTATLFLLYLIAENKKIKTILLFTTILVGISVILQKVHYTIDVLAAPFFTYGAYIIVNKIFGLPEEVKDPKDNNRVESKRKVKDYIK